MGHLSCLSSFTCGAPLRSFGEAAAGFGLGSTLRVKGGLGGCCDESCFWSTVGGVVFLCCFFELNF